MTTTKLKVHSLPKLNAYIGKFTPIDKSLLMEIEDGKLVSKSYTSEKTVLKLSSVGLKEIFDFSQVPDDVKIGIINAESFVKTFKQLQSDSTNLDIDFEKTNEGNLTTEFRLYDKYLKFKLKSGSMKIFKVIGKDILNALFDTTGSLTSFRIDKDNLSKVASLCSIDSESDSLEVSSVNGKIIFSGKSFEYELPGVTCDKDFSMVIYKKHFAFVDLEDSDVFVKDVDPKGFIFKSLESDTKVIIGRVVA
jgi:hypothetical protein